MADTQSRKWQITINNPKDKNQTHDAIKLALSSIKPIAYACMADEIGLETQTPHTHIFVACSSPIRFSALKRRFPEAHIEQARGSAEENRVYIKKSGKWADDPKSDTSCPGTFEEWGEMQEEPGQGCRSDIAEIYNNIRDGMSNAEIMAQNPDTAKYIGKMDKIRQDILEAQYCDDWRNLCVTYVWGPTATGKTRGILEKYGYSSVYRVTDYNHPFDRYAQEPCICFDEFRSSLPIGDMLDYLDGYPLALPARYANRQACYTEVYLVSNIDLRAQYPNVQKDEPATWAAFLRRIGSVIRYFEPGAFQTYTLEEYLKDDKVNLSPFLDDKDGKTKKPKSSSKKSSTKPKKEVSYKPIEIPSTSLVPTEAEILESAKAILLADFAKNDF